MIVLRLLIVRVSGAAALTGLHCRARANRRILAPITEVNNALVT